MVERRYFFTPPIPPISSPLVEVGKTHIPRPAYTTSTVMSTWTWIGSQAECRQDGDEDSGSEHALERLTRLEVELSQVKVESKTTLDLVLEKLERIETAQQEILSRLSSPPGPRLRPHLHIDPPSTPIQDLAQRGSRATREESILEGSPKEEISEESSPVPEIPIRRLSVAERRLVLNFRARNDSSASMDSLVFDALSSPRGPVRDLESTVRAGVEELCQITGFKQPGDKFAKRQWEIVRTGQHCHIWMAKGAKTDAILVRGGTYAAADVRTVARWLVEENLCSALKGITHQSEVLNAVGKTTVKRVTSVKTGLVVSSKREFVVATSQTELDGAIVLCTRSLPENNSYPVKKGYTRGFLHSAGFILQPMKSSEAEGCNVQFAIHLDMKSSSGRSVTLRVDPLINSLVELTESIRHGKGMKLYDCHVMLRKETCASSLSPEEQDQLRDISQTAVANLRKLYESAIDVEKSCDESWSTFHDADGIVVSECLSDALPSGILRASCSTIAPPSTIRRLLMDKAESIDGLLEKKYTLARIGEGLIVQLLAYGPIWPVGSRDYLIVTSEVGYPTPQGEGFVIASTSIDDICEEEDAYSHSNSRYTRSSMRLAGYVGVPNGSGGTDLQMFVDMDVYSYVPGWLVHILAQYGLAEMMNRIRIVSMGQRVQIRPFQLDKIVDKLRERGADKKPGGLMRRVSRIISKEESRKNVIIESLDIEAKHAPSSIDDAGEADDVEDELSIGIGVADDDDVEFASTQFDSNYGSESPDVCSLSDGLDLRAKAVCAEARRLHLCYLSGHNDQGHSFEWIEKMNKKGVIVHSSVVVGSTWLAIKALTSIQADTTTTLKFLLDDSRLGSFDDMFDTFEVNIFCLFSIRFIKFAF